MTHDTIPRTATVYELPEACLPWPPRRVHADAPPAPIPLPLRTLEAEHADRAARATDGVRAQWQRDVATAEANGRDVGHAHGLRLGYVQGWAYGLTCGLLAGFAAATLLHLLLRG